MTTQRPSGRALDEMRPVRITHNYTRHAEGSVLVEFGDTKVICTASVETQVPRFLRGRGAGWVTAEYGMLPGATHSRGDREAVRGRQSGRTVEIQRLIGRALRSCVNMKRLGERTLRVDCDVIQADGGTRTASITGGAVALRDALAKMNTLNAFKEFAASVSVGIWKGQPVLDLDYAEDSAADTDMNVVMLASGGLLEVQGTAEKAPFSEAEFSRLLALAQSAAPTLFAAQNAEP